MSVKITPRQLYENMKKEVIPCGVCKSPEYVPLFRCGDYGMDIDSAICKICGFVFTNPRPTQEEINRFYRGNYRKSDLSPAKPIAPYEPGSSISRRAEWLFSVAKPVLEKQGVREPRVLDVGCGSGIILHTFKTLWPGSRLYGVEPSPTYGKYAEGKNSAVIHSGDLESFIAEKKSLSGSFNLIVLNHVLEHLYEPVEKLKALREFLADGGLLLVQVPNPFSTESPGILRMFHLAHVNQFSSDTLKLAFPLSGFEILGEFPSQPRVTTFLCRKSPRFMREDSVEPLTDDKLRALVERIRHKASAEYLEKNPHKKNSGNGLFRSAKGMFRHWLNYHKFQKLIRDNRVVIVGTGAAAADIQPFGENARFLVCDGGFSAFVNGRSGKTMDLFLCSQPVIRKKFVKNKLSEINPGVFLSDDLGFIKKKKGKKHWSGSLIRDYRYDRPFTQKLLTPSELREVGLEEIASSELRLLQIALYFKPKEVYIVGDEFLNNRYVWDDPHENGDLLTAKEKFFKIVSKKYPNIFCVSKESLLAKYLPIKRPTIDA